jgi:hypothetical protein
VEDHPANRHLRLEHLAQVPGDRLALAILVGREQDLVGLLDVLAEGGDHLLLLRADHVEGREVVLDVDAEPRPRLPLVLGGDVGGPLGEVADVPDARLYGELGPEEARDRARLGGRLDDHERALLCVGHGESP